MSALILDGTATDQVIVYGELLVEAARSATRSSLNMGNWIVTGGAGFIGSHVCDAFLADGWSVTALDDLSSGRRGNVPPGAELVVEDIRSSVASELLADGGELAIEHSVRGELPDSVEGLVRQGSRNYGENRITFFAAGPGLTS